MKAKEKLNRAKRLAKTRFQKASRKHRRDKANKPSSESPVYSITSSPQQNECIKGLLGGQAVFLDDLGAETWALRDKYNGAIAADWGIPPFVYIRLEDGSIVEP
jgi:hypothetical protein